MSQLPKPLLTLIEHLRKLPGVGSKTAEKYAFDLLSWQMNELQQLSNSLCDVKEKIEFCPVCHCLKDHLCPFCDNFKRDQNVICVIEKPLDVFHFEKTQSFSGVYHALGGLLNPLSFKSADKLNIETLLNRINPQTQEVIIALDATLEGEATTLLLQEKFKGISVNLSRLAYGIPVGSPLNYVDGSTLSRALSLRSKMNTVP
jgi:recombination protein RecR